MLALDNACEPQHLVAQHLSASSSPVLSTESSTSGDSSVLAVSDSPEPTCPASSTSASQCGRISADNQQQQQQQQRKAQVVNIYDKLPPNFTCLGCDRRRRRGSSAEDEQQQQQQHASEATKLLPCLHSVCEQCLSCLTAQHKFFLPCPVCKQHLAIPYSRNFVDNWLLRLAADKMADAVAVGDCLVLRSHLVPADVTAESAATSDTDSDHCGHRPGYCPLHDLMPLEFYCQTCDYAVCSDCLKPPPPARLDSSEEYLSTDVSSASSTGHQHAATVSRHEGHSYTPLSAAYRVERLKIERLAQALQMRIGEAEDAAEHLDAIEQNLASRFEDSLGLINKTFDKAVERLHQRRVEVEAQLSSTCHSKQSVVDANRQAVNACITSARKSQAFLSKLLEEANCDDHEPTPLSGIDLLVARKQFEQQADIVSQPFPLNTVQLEEKQLQFSFVDSHSEKLLRSIDNFGAVISTGSDFMAQSGVMSPVEADADAKSIASIQSPSSSDYFLRSNSQVLNSPTPVDITVKLPPGSAPSGGISNNAKPRSWTSVVVNVPQVVLLTAIDENGVEAALPTNHDRALGVAVRDAMDRVGTCDLKRVSAGGFLLTFTVPREGIFEMEITLFGMPVSSSPFVLRCYKSDAQMNASSTTSNSTTSPAKVPRPLSAKPGVSSRLRHSAVFHHTDGAKTETKRTATPKLSPTATKSSTTPTGSKLLSNKSTNSTNAIMHHTKLVMPAKDKARVRSMCGSSKGLANNRSQSQLQQQQQHQHHDADCPSHCENQSRHPVHQRQAVSAQTSSNGQNSVGGSNSSSSKAAELEQLKNFCKRVVMLTSGSAAPAPSDTHSIADSDRSNNTTQNHAEDDFLFSFGRKGRARGEFSNIQDVCVTTDGRLLVSDSGNQCVQVFSSTGEFRFRFGTAGRNPGQLARPTGLAVGQRGDIDRIYLADYENRCVHAFTDDGRHIGRMGVGRLLGPKGICLVPDSSLLVAVDNRASEIVIFDLRTHKSASKFGQRGSHPHQLAGPHFACVLDNQFCSVSAESGEISSSRPRIAVTDFHNHAVKVFDLDGRLQSVIGRGIGEAPGQFNAATGLTVDPADGGTLYAADWGNSRIQCFGPGGGLRGVVNCFAQPPMFGPQGLAMDSTKQRLVVADSGNHCVKIFKAMSSS